jgi:ribonuclease BN (tRNA processing enzyme)
MKIRVLGCHGSDQLLIEKDGSRQCGACGFLVNGTLLIDAGTVGSRLSLDEQRSIRHVLVSHIHFDHIRELPTFVDNLGDDHSVPTTVAGIGAVLKGIKQHIFNGAVYPNFFRLPRPDRPVLIAQTLEPGEERILSGLRVVPILVNHTIPTAGFIVQDRASAILYSGDTYRTDELWQVASRVPTLKAAFIETSFPNEMAELAKFSKHLTPALLAEEFAKIGRPDLPLYVYHMKPRFRDRIVRQLRDLAIPTLVVLEEGQDIEV